MTVPVTELARNFAELLNRVVDGGETLVLTSEGKAVAQLCPMPSGRRLGGLPEVLGSLPRLAAGDAEAFAADIEESRAEMMSSDSDDPPRL